MIIEVEASFNTSPLVWNAVIQTGTNPVSSHAYPTTVLQQEYINMWEGIHPTAHENF
jgi:hypothetical protein